MDEIDLMRTRLCPGGSIEFPPGWVSLVISAGERLSRVYPDYKIVQIKSKFGGLRFYVAPAPSEEVADQFKNIIGQAEDKSYQTCEVCGKTGSLKMVGRWYTTLCEIHLSDRIEQRRLAWSTDD